MTVLTLTVRGLNGSVIPNTSFKITAGYPDDTYDPEISMTSVVTFTTDNDGEATVTLTPGIAPYFLSRASGMVDDVIAYKFYVPIGSTSLTLGLVYVDLKTQFKLLNDKSLYSLIEAKVAMLACLEQAKVSAAAASGSASAASISAASGSAAAASAASAAAAVASVAEAGLVSAIAGADGDVGLSVISDGGMVTTVGSNISVNIKAKPRGLLIIAHRGYADLGPQNTMTAFTAAAAAGAAVLEVDVQVTSDGQLVCFHDDDMSSLTGGALTGTVASHTWAEMQNIDVGTHYSSVFATSRIPLFSEFLTFVRRSGVQFWAEIKNYRTSADITLMVNAVINAGVEHLCVMQSFILSDLTAVRALSKKVGLNHALNAADYSADGATLAALGGEVWRSTSTTRITAAPSYVATLQALGVKVAAYTPTRSLYVQDMQDYGVDAVFVDRYLPGGV